MALAAAPDTSTSTVHANKRSRITVQIEEQEVVGSEVGVEEGSEVKPKKLRLARPLSRTTSKTIISLATLPFDALHGICRFLDPGSLLSLVQTSKSLRRTFLDKSSATLWKATRYNVGMPDLEAEGLSEPAYAALVYGSCCQMCGTEAGKIRTDYYMRYRCCIDCLKTNLLTEEQIISSYPTVRKLAFQSAVQTLYSAGSDRDVKTPHYLVSDVLAQSDILRALSADIAFPIAPSYDLADLVAGEEDDELVVGSVLADYLQQREEYKVKLEADAEELYELEDRLLDEAKLEMQRRKLARRRQIEDKLAAYGHFEEEDYRHLYRSQKIFQSTEPLRDVEWRKHRDKLVSLAQRNKMARLAALRPLPPAQQGLHQQARKTD